MTKLRLQEVVPHPIEVLPPQVIRRDAMSLSCHGRQNRDGLDVQEQTKRCQILTYGSRLARVGIEEGCEDVRIKRDQHVELRQPNVLRFSRGDS